MQVPKPVVLPMGEPMSIQAETIQAEAVTAPTGVSSNAQSGIAAGNLGTRSGVGGGVGSTSATGSSFPGSVSRNL